MSNTHDHETMDVDYQVRVSPREQRPTQKQQKAPSYGRRRGGSPQAFNGIHRRRRKKIGG